MNSVWRTLALTSWIVLCALSCGTPDYNITNCQVRCESECPDGFVCREGLCVTPGYQLQCTEPLAVRGPKSVEQFACEPLSIVLKPDGGRGPYHWTVRGVGDSKLPRGLVVEDTNEELIVFADAETFEPTESLALEIEVSDELGESTRVPLDVYLRRCTQAVTPELGPLCVGEEVSIPLQAEGGFAHYRWQVDGKLPAGLRLEGTTLVGSPEASAVGTFPVTLLVEDSAQPESQESQADGGQTTASGESADAGQPAAQGEEGDNGARVLKSSIDVELEVQDCLRISELAQALEVCDGDTANIVLQAQGGTAPYTWAAKGLPEGLELDSELGAITGAPKVLGAQAATVTVQDAEGEVATSAVQLAVNACPAIRTHEISTCVGEPFDQTLSAEPDDGALAWRKLQGPDELQLDVDGLVHWLPTKAMQGSLSLAVSNAEGERTGEIPLTAIAADDPSCNRLELVTRALPDACAGQYYEFQLIADGGSGGYSWTPQGAGVNAWPQWLALDEDNGVLSGVAPEGARTYDLTLGLTSDVALSPHVKLVQRASCKYAFIGRSKGSERLFLADVRQTSQPELEPRDLTADFEGQADAVDFDVAADGQRLAFVTRAAAEAVPAADELTIVSTTAQMPQPAALHFDGDAVDLATIVDVAWANSEEPSSDADPLAPKKLAVLFTTSDQRTQLLLLDDSADLHYTEPVEVDFLGAGGVFWLGPNACYLGRFIRDPDDEQKQYFGVTCHSLEEDGVLGDGVMSLPLPLHLAPEPLLVQMLTTGHEVALFARAKTIDSFNGYVHFDADLSGWNLSGVPDPSLSWVVRPGNEEFLERETDLVRFPVAPEVASPGEALGPEWILPDCEVPIAWGATGQVLACSSEGTLRIANFDAEGALTGVRAVADSGDLSIGDHARVFSLDANTFIYDTEEGQIRSVDLGAGTLHSVVLEDAPSGGFSALLPVASGVVLHVEDRLQWLTPDAASLDLNADHRLEAPLPCGRDFDLSGPEGWCGNQGHNGLAVAVAGGSGVVFRDTSGAPYVVDLAVASGHAPLTAQVNAAKITCLDSGCVSRIKSVEALLPSSEGGI